MSAAPGMPRRTAGHERLNFMEGEWTTHEEYPPTPWMPGGGSGEGEASIAWEIGGLCLVTRYETRGMMGESFQGHGIMGFDPAENVYVAWWFDVTMPTGTEGRGSFEKGSLVVHYRHRTPEGIQEIRAVTTPVSDGEFRMVGSSLVDGKWVEAVRNTYKRK